MELFWFFSIPPDARAQRYVWVTAKPLPHFIRYRSDKRHVLGAELPQLADQGHKFTGVFIGQTAINVDKQDSRP